MKTITDIMEGLGNGTMRIVFSHGMRRGEIFDKVKEEFDGYMSDKTLSIQFSYDFYGMAEKLFVSILETFCVEVCTDYVIDSQGKSAEAFWCMLREICNSNSLNGKNTVLNIDIPQNIYQKSFISLQNGDDDGKYSFMMQFLYYLVNYKNDKITAFVSIQSEYLAEFAMNNKSRQPHVCSVCL